MAKIDPMHHLVNTIFDDREVVIFLGGGASMEGKQDKQMFPGSDDLIERVLQKYQVKPKSKKERLNSFFSIIEQWEKEKKLSARLREFLEGEPGLAHYHLAALSIALFGESNTLLYLTKNFDDLINQAFKDLQRNHVRKFRSVVIPIHPSQTASEFQEIISNAEASLKRGCPVILKLLGDLNSPKPILREDDIEFQPEVESKLIEWMAKPMIVIGYSFSDKKIRQLLIASRGTSPIFIINPSRNIPPAVNDLDRIHHIKSNFSDFVYKLLEIFQKKNPTINKKIDKILEFLDPTTLFPDFNSIHNRVKQCSKASILRAEERIPKIEVNGKARKLVPIPREDTSPDFERFIQSDKPLLAVIGDSGSGKSTLLYRVAKGELNQFVTLFYDVHHLQSAGSLTEKLSQDFRCEKRQLETMFGHFDKILSKENKKLLAIIDGLNESMKIDPSEMKAEIEDLAAKLPQSIKIVYSCRTVYWDSYIKVNAPISLALYYGSKEFILYFYSKKEAKKAFAIYKNLFEFQGNYESLKNEFKEKIRDPLMLRMLAEGYQRKKLPTFAPAVKIFRNYEETLKRKFKGNPFLIGFIYELVSSKLEEVGEREHVSDQFDARAIRSNIKLLNHFQMLKPKDPLILLEDEGILSLLDKKENIYRFTYDRFFEYLLGKEIGKQFEIHSRDEFREKLCKYILKFQRFHFSFVQALKSEIIRQNIDDPKGNWSFFDAGTLTPLLNDKNAAIVNFAKEALRELTFESEKQDTFEILKKVTDNGLQWKYLAMDIAPDSPKIVPILVEGIFSGDKVFTRRCIQVLIATVEKYLSRNAFEELLLLQVKKDLIITQKHAKGLIYYSSVIFSLEDRMGNDPICEIENFWKKVFKLIHENLSNSKNLILFEFINILKDEGPLFFSNDAEGHGMEYLWKGMTDEERNAALKMIPLLLDCRVPLDTHSQNILNFFGSELKYWGLRNEPHKNVIYTYKLEYRISQWILIQRSKDGYVQIKEVLNNFANTKFWLSIDFALCTLKFILQIMYPENRKILTDGFQTMKEWVSLFEREADEFYMTLYKENPLIRTFNPLAQTAIIDGLYFAKPKGPIKFLAERLIDDDHRKVRLALLCARHLRRENVPLPQILGTLELVIDSKDDTVCDWLEVILKEIYLVYPRQMEDFFWKNHFSYHKIQAIKNRDEVLDSGGIQFAAEPLYKAFFLNTHSHTRQETFAKWYEKLLKAPDLGYFCQELFESFCKNTLGNY